MHKYLADICKVFLFLVFKVTFSLKLRDPFRDPSLKHFISINKIEINKGVMLKMGYITTYVTSWDKISRMSQFFHMELNIPVFRPHPVLQIGEN